MEHSRFCFSGDFNGQAAAAAAIEKTSLSRSILRYPSDSTENAYSQPALNDNSMQHPVSTRTDLYLPTGMLQPLN